MGFGTAEVEFVVAAGRLGVSFERTMTLGRQRLTLKQKDLERLSGIDAKGDGFVEALLMHLGADEVRSLDASGYEGATDVHDLNEPAPTALHGRFSAVIDGGTLEHVFNLPEALRSAMVMVEPGGHLILMVPCNNSPGHGFYQVTPELVYRSLSRENGYEMRLCYLHEDRGGWYAVVDPSDVGRRCEFRTRRTAYLFVVARRVSAAPVFANWPQQSDYTTEWSGANASRQTTPTSSAKRLAMRVKSRFYPPSYRRRRAHFSSSRL
jgi:hypothetical protein